MTTRATRPGLRVLARVLVLLGTVLVPTVVLAPAAGAHAVLVSSNPADGSRVSREPAQVRLVAAHSWDVSGALAAGCKAAFVARPGMVPSPIGGQPDIIEADIASVVQRILTIGAAASGR